MLARIRLLLVVALVIAFLAGGLAVARGVPDASAISSTEETGSVEPTESVEPSGSVEPTDTVVEDVVRGTTTLISVDPSGEAAWYYSQQPSLSRDGRFVAFVSYASLVAGDNNSAADIFVRDRVTSTTVNASVRTDGVQLNKISIQPHISADGRYVAFTSEATNVFHNGYGFEAYRRDLVSNTIDKVSVTRTGGDPQDGAFASDISADGRYVLFGSTADYEYVMDDDNDYGDVFLRDMDLGTTELVSLTDDEEQGDGWSHSAVMSDNGRYVAFVSYATNMVGDGRDGVFLRDRVLGTTVRVSQDVAGKPLMWANGPVSITADGSKVVFSAVYEGNWHVFIHDVPAGTTECVSVAPDGSLGNGQCNEADVSADGSRVAFVSMATNLVLGDVNRKTDVFFRDLATGVTKRVSVTNNREEATLGGGGDACGPPSCDASGSAFAFAAIGTSYGDPRIHELVYVRDLETTVTVEQSAKHLEKTTVVSLSAYGATAAVNGQMYTGEGAFAAEKLSVVDVRGGAPVVATTSADGRFSVNLRPLSKTTYRIAPTNDAVWAQSAERLVTVIPRAYVSNPVAPAKMRSSRHYTVYGTIRPRHKAGSSPVRIYRWKKTSTGRWKPYSYVTAAVSDVTGGSRYSRKIRLPYRGAWRLRAYAPADSGHANAWSSGYDYVRVY